MATAQVAASVRGNPDWERHKIVIAAAVAAVCGNGAVIRSVKPAQAASAAWVRQGWLALQSSHDLKVRRAAGGRVLPVRGVSQT